MDFDLDIANYRPEDVVTLFQLPQMYCDADVVEKERVLRGQLMTEDMPAHLKTQLTAFLTAAGNMPRTKSTCAARSTPTRSGRSPSS